MKHTFSLAASAAVLLWASFPPCKAAFLVWLVPVFWAILILRVPSQEDKGTETRPQCPGPAMDVTNESGSPCGLPWVAYGQIWLAGSLFWLASFSWMSGFQLVWVKALWIAHSLFLGVFWMLFIGISRTAVHSLGVPVVIAAPTVWCGLEWGRKSLPLFGFPLASLEHTQYQSPAIIQIADLFGEYGVGLLIVSIGTSLAHLLPSLRLPNHSVAPAMRRLHSRLAALTTGAILLTATIFYGQDKLSSIKYPPKEDTGQRSAEIAILQGNVSGVEGMAHSGIVSASTDPNSSPLSLLSEQCQRLSQGVGASVDLVVWPEDSCHLLLKERMLEKGAKTNRMELMGFAKDSQASILVGVQRQVIDGVNNINWYRSAILVDPTRGAGPVYDKTKLSLLEHNPLASFFPGVFSNQGRYTPGHSIPAFPIRSRQPRLTDTVASIVPTQEPPYIAAVNICFDGTFPHCIRRQTNALAEKGIEPDVLINVSNDCSWYFESEIEMHLATHVFRAIENRKPYISATNSGYSAWIDPAGRFLTKGTKGEAGHLRATVCRWRSSSLYRHWGDWLPVSCLLFNAAVLLWALTRKKASSELTTPF